jgi:hypothetical protein
MQLVWSMLTSRSSTFTGTDYLYLGKQHQFDLALLRVAEPRLSEKFVDVGDRACWS